jgi:hypothetical protein
MDCGNDIHFFLLRGLMRQKHGLSRQRDCYHGDHAFAATSCSLGCGMIRTHQEEMRMNLSTNDFVNHELSIEELEAIAAGSFLGWIKHEASSALHWIEGPGLRDAVAAVKWIGEHLPPVVVYNGHKTP